MRKSWWKVLGVLFVAYAIVGGLLLPVPRQHIINETIRNLYYHVPMWFAMILLFSVAVVYAIKFLRSGMAEKGFIKEIRADGKINLSLQPVGNEGRDNLQQLILTKLDEAGGTLPLNDKSSPEVISRMFGASKGSFKKAIGALFKQVLIVIHGDRIERSGP